MIQPQPPIAVSLIAPGIFVVFAFVYCGAWFVERRRHYLLLLALACMLFCIGALVQVLHLPEEIYANAVLSSMFYTAAVIAAAEGIVRRSRKRLSLPVDLAIMVAVTGLVVYFCYLSPNLLARIYIQNFGYGAILTVASLLIIPRPGTRPVDRALFWIMFVFGVQFIPRTVLTIGPNAVFSAKTFGQSPFWQALQVSLVVMGAVLAFAILAAAFSDLLDDLRRERDTDALTGVLNRGGFESRSNAVVGRASLGRASLILCDLDHFKSINDAYGHQAGDEVIRRFGAVLSGELRWSDLAGRIGGEEFAILMPDVSESDAAAVAERVRAQIEEQSFDEFGLARRVTASFGVVERRAGERLQDLIARADQLLYSAKSAGRNRVARTATAAAAAQCDTPAVSDAPARSCHSDVTLS